MIRARTWCRTPTRSARCRLCEGDVPEAFRSRVEAWRSESPVLKINCALSRLPHFPQAAPGVQPHRAMVTISHRNRRHPGRLRGQPAGESRRPAWCELYFHTAYDPSVAPPGRHAMSVFAQYVPYQLGQGDWESRREAIADRAMTAIAQFAPDVAECVVHRQVLGPPDVEARIGLTGGHIFQGECLPDQMWDRRFSASNPDSRPLPVRGGDPPGRQRHRAEWPQRRHGRTTGSPPRKAARRPRRPRLAKRRSTVGGELGISAYRPDSG